jgi:hypothetical protein
MASERGKLAVLGSIVVIFIAVVAWQITRDEAGQPARAAGPAATQGSAPAAKAGQAGVPAVELAALGNAGDEPIDTGRDPFRFGAAPAPPAAPGAGRGIGSSSDLRPGGPGAQVVPSEPAGPPPPPPIQLRYIGTAKQGANGRQLVVLKDDRGIYYGAEGDVIEGRYRILRVAADSVDVAYVDGRGRRTIPLTGGQ